MDLSGALFTVVNVASESGVDEKSLLLNMTFILLLGGFCTILLRKLKMPTIIGYLMAGIILAALWPDLDRGTVSLLSDLGLVLLMFSIGMELNIRKLRVMGGFAMLVVMIQVPVMLIGGFIFGSLMGWSSVQCLVLGGIISGSSTAVIVAVLRETQVLSEHDTQKLVLITVIEDVAQVIILSMLTPILNGGEMSMDSVIWLLVIIISFIAISMYLGLNLIPRFLDYIKRKGFPDEVVLVFSLGLCFCMAFLSVHIGMSMAIGAFLMGVITSQSITSDKVSHQVEPMRDIFMAMFFISIGLKISPAALVSNIPMIILIFAVYVFLKTASVFIAYVIGNTEDNSLHFSFLNAISLSAMGEFAFIISSAAVDAGIIDDEIYASVIGAALLSMLALPWLSRCAPKFCETTYSICPSSIYNAVNRVVKFFSRENKKMKEGSTAFRSRMTSILAQTYANIIILIIMLILYWIYMPSVFGFVNNQLPSISEVTIGVVILLLEFMLTMIPLYTLAGKIKLLDDFMVKGMDDIMEDETESYAVHRLLGFINRWTIVLFLDFLLLLFMPTGLPFVHHLIVMVIGVGLLSMVYLFKYWNRS